MLLLRLAGVVFRERRASLDTHLVMAGAVQAHLAPGHGIALSIFTGDTCRISRH